MSKEVNEILKYFKRNNQTNEKKDQIKSYAQALTPLKNTREVLKIKETFSNLQAKKFEKIQKIINGEGKSKLRIHITTKEPLRKQVIVLMSNDNKMKFMEDSSTHIININRVLKNIKSKVMADFVQTDQTGIIIATSKVAAPLNLHKNMNYIEADNIEVPHLSQSKSYLKIIGIPYLLKNTNTSLTADIVESIIKNNHVFNNIAVISRPRVIKVSLKSDIDIIWLNIWDIQSESKAQGLTNRCFNLESYIITI